MNLLETLYPKVRAEILRLLFAEAGRQMYLRELARSSGLAVGTMQKEVANLVAADLLVERRDGNRLYFSANTEHPVFADLHSLVLKTAGLREPLAEALKKMLGVEAAFVFGSCAGDKSPNARSDVDLFIVGDVGLRKLAPALASVANAIGREINPVVYTAETFRRKRAAGDAFIKNVLKGKKMWIVGGGDNELK